MPKKEIEPPQVEPVGKELLDKLEEFNREIESHRKAIEVIRIKARETLKEAGFPWSLQNAVASVADIRRTNGPPAGEAVCEVKMVV